MEANDMSRQLCHGCDLNLTWILIVIMKRQSRASRWVSFVPAAHHPRTREATRFLSHIQPSTDTRGFPVSLIPTIITPEDPQRLISTYKYLFRHHRRTCVWMADPDPYQGFAAFFNSNR